MAQKIPQNITREDKLVGPLTLKQFLYVLGGVSIVFIAYQYYAMQYLYLIEFILIGFVAAFFSLALAFGQVNGRPFGLFLLNLLKFTSSSKRRIWDKEPRNLLADIKVQASDLKDTKTEIKERQDTKSFKMQLDKLAHILDTGGTINQDKGDAITSQIHHVKPDVPKPTETELNVEDVLEETD